MDADGKAPKDLGKRYGKIIMEADGFAQVGGGPGGGASMIVPNAICMHELGDDSGIAGRWPQLMDRHQTW